MKEMTLAQLGWDHIEFPFEVRWVAGDREESGVLHWCAYEKEPIFISGQGYWSCLFGGMKFIEKEKHPMSAYPQHTLIKIVEE